MTSYRRQCDVSSTPCARWDVELPVELLIMHHGQDKMDHVLGRNGPRFRDVTSHFGIPSVAGRGERKGVHHHVIYMFTTILRPSYDHPSLGSFFFFIFDRRQKSLRALLSLSLSLSHTHTHKCNLSYFPYITYNVRFKRNPKYSGTKTTRTIITPKIWQKHVDFNLFIIIFFFQICSLCSSNR